MDVTVFVTVYPEEGNFPAVAKALLAVADHPYDVVSVSHPRAGFKVSEELFERFEAAGQTEESNVAQGAPPGETEPVKRRPGRPRKNVESDASKEE